MGSKSQRQARALHPTYRRPRKYLHATIVEWIMLLVLCVLLVGGAYGLLTDHQASSQSDPTACQSTTVPAAK